MTLLALLMLLAITASAQRVRYTEPGAQSIYELLMANGYESAGSEDYNIVQIDDVHPVIDVVKDYRVNAINDSARINGTVAVGGLKDPIDQVRFVINLAGELRRMQCNHIQIELPLMAVTAAFNNAPIESSDGKTFHFVSDRSEDYPVNGTDNKSVVQNLLPTGWVVVEQTSIHTLSMDEWATMQIISPGISLDQITDQTKAKFNQTLATKRINLRF